MDDNIVTYWVDGSPDVQFQIRMASGVGWVDDVTEASGAAFHPEANGPWGTQYIGKGSGMGGWYNEWRTPFNRTLTVTVRTPKRLLNLTAQDKDLLSVSTCGSISESEHSHRSTSCTHFPKTDCWGADMPNGSVPLAKTFAECCAACADFPGCAAFSFHLEGNDCQLKSACVDQRPDSTASGPCDAGCLGDSAATVIEYAMEIFRDDLAGGAVEAASVEECRSHCIAKKAAGCLAFTFYGAPAPGQPSCRLKTNGTNTLPSSTTTISGTLATACASPGGEITSSGFMSVRGVYGKDTASISIAGVAVPPTARLVTQQRSADLAPLDFYDIIDQETGTGLVLGNTLSVIGTGPGFMEGCFHFFSPHNSEWNDTKGHQLMSTVSITIIRCLKESLCCWLSCRCCYRWFELVLSGHRRLLQQWIL